MAHLDPTHDAVACAGRHDEPHAPQSVSVSKGSSQPLRTSRSQSPKPTPHDAIAQRPDTHAGVALANEQRAVQVPQCSVVSRRASQPFATLPSQSSKPGAHPTIAQLWVAHEAIALAGAHVARHAPHEVGRLSGDSQPFSARASQSPNPGRQDATRHEPRAQVPTALSGEQARRQAPQSVAVTSEVSHPLAEARSQSPYPAAQVPTRQTPSEQTGFAWGSEHGPHDVAESSWMSSGFAASPSSSAGASMTPPTSMDTPPSTIP
jgi:hypothetical protein